jgi:hypothetical protein
MVGRLSDEDRTRAIEGLGLLARAAEEEMKARSAKPEAGNGKPEAGNAKEA